MPYQENYVNENSEDEVIIKMEIQDDMGKILKMQDISLMWAYRRTLNKICMCPA